MSEKSLLGFQVDSGESVYVGVHHLAIFGMTQLSGKTTALEALISRSGLRAEESALTMLAALISHTTS